MTGTPRRAWLVWGLAVFAYAIAVFHRASLGVAGIEAQHRFGASAAVLALFSVLQLAVYASLQIPVGVLLDRFGSRRLIVTGAVVMAVGQLTLATAHSVPGALLARVLVGSGDALTFISVLRLVTTWFAPRNVPVVTQLTGLLGQLGQVAAAYPLVALLRHAGWGVSFAGAGAVSLLVAIAVAVALRDGPAGMPVVAPASIDDVRRNLRSAWREPGTRIGLWTHFSAQFSGNVFALLWGYPFLVAGEGLSPGTAGLLLTLLVLVGMGVGPLLGHLVGTWPLRRSVIVLGIVVSTVIVWTAVLAWPGRAPLPLLVLLVLVLGINGPGSMVAFDFARTTNPPARLGSASGIVNVGGFLASLLTIFMIGVVLDLLSPAGVASYSLGAFRAAFAVQYLVWAVGLAGLVRYRRKLRRQLEDSGVEFDYFRHAVVRRLRAARA